MDKTAIHMVPEPRKKELVNATYGIIGCMQQGHNQLGPGVPEYIYQEALAMELAANGFTAHKELQFYPTFR
jgi:GxxExxY protein